MASNPVNDVQSVVRTFSSWDRCMEKSYCKYPVIIGIVVAGLIVVSIIWCCVRCCCCGMACCCGCLSCFNRCCPSGRRRRRSHRYHDSRSDYQQPNPYMGYVPPSNPPAYLGPNTATFDAPVRNVNGDSLPAMPTWADGKVHESTPRDDVELGQMTQPGQATGVVPVARAWTSKGGYSELRNQDDYLPQPGSYRGASSTHPYASDLGAQGMMSQADAYAPPTTDRFQVGSAMPAPDSLLPQAAYPATQARPPSLLRIGRRPVNQSLQKI